MSALLDTNVLLWLLAGDESRISRSVRDRLEAIDRVAVSAASVWEIEIKRAIGKLRAPDGVVAAIESAGFLALPITLGDAEHAGRLPPHHRDPFDRMLIAQANRLDAIIATRDTAFAAYGVDTLSA